MKVPYSWLGEFVELTEGPQVTAELLTAAGLKVEKVHRLGEGVEGVVAGRVISVDPHPDADRLTLVGVDLGGRELRVVCGARNIGAGDVVPVATPGSRLPELGVLAARTFRGIVSEGMLCSAAELGVGGDSSGILILDPAVDPGADIRDALGLTDTVLELEITPNRPDAMSLLGIAREVAACTGAALLGLSGNEMAARPSSLHARLRVSVEDADGCPRYLARVIDAVRVGPSPALVQRRLSLAGIRPIANVVDATNYALLVTGHPMHAFDLGTLAGSAIVVRRAAEGEKLVTIDGESRILDPDDLIIADESTPVALAGVMGGLESAVSASTVSVALESAYFNPGAVFRSSRRHGLRTEASARFERDVDPNGVEFAANLAAGLIAEWAQAEVAAGTAEFYPTKFGPRSVTVRPARANSVLGIDLAPGEMATALERLGLPATIAESEISVEVPTRRRDLAAEEDLIEEIARVVGYDKIPTTLPSGRNRAGGLSPQMQATRRLRSALVGAGLTEARTSILVGPSAAYMFQNLSLTEDERLNKGNHAVLRLSNPLTEEESTLRPSLTPGLLASVARNFARRNTDVRLFEIGPVFRDGREPFRLGLALGGESAQQWHLPTRQLDFYDLKGAVEVIVDELNLAGVIFRAPEETPDQLHPARTAEVCAGDTLIGVLGQISDKAAAKMDLGYPVYVAELDMTALLRLAREHAPGTAPVARFPAVLLDLAVSVPEEAASGELLDTARSEGGESLEAVRLIDVYRGEQVGKDRKSLAFALFFRRNDRTLTEAEALKSRDAIAAAMAKDFGGQVRS